MTVCTSDCSLNLGILVRCTCVFSSEEEEDEDEAEGEEEEEEEEEEDTAPSAVDDETEYFSTDVNLLFRCVNASSSLIPLHSLS